MPIQLISSESLRLLVTFFFAKRRGGVPFLKVPVHTITIRIVNSHTHSLVQEGSQHYNTYIKNV